MRTVAVKIAVAALVAGFIAGGLGVARAQVSDGTYEPPVPTTAKAGVAATALSTAPTQTG